MKYELIDGDTRYINVMVNHGWKIENTFPNQYPQPYFYALMRHDTLNIDDVYSVQNIQEHFHQGKELNPFNK